MADRGYRSAPDQPTITSVERVEGTNDRLLVSFDLPDYQGPDGIDSLELRYRTSGGGWETKEGISPQAASVEATGLSPGAEYEFRLYAKSTYAISPASQTARGTVPLTADLGDRQGTLGTDGSSTADELRLRYGRTGHVCAPVHIGFKEHLPTLLHLHDDLGFPADMSMREFKSLKIPAGLDAKKPEATVAVELSLSTDATEALVVDDAGTPNTLDLSEGGATKATALDVSGVSLKHERNWRSRGSGVSLTRTRNTIDTNADSQRSVSLSFGAAPGRDDENNDRRLESFLSANRAPLYLTGLTADKSSGSVDIDFTKTNSATKEKLNKALEANALVGIRADVVPGLIAPAQNMQVFYRNNSIPRWEIVNRVFTNVQLPQWCVRNTGATSGFTRIVFDLNGAFRVGTTGHGTHVIPEKNATPIRSLFGGKIKLVHQDTGATPFAGAPVGRADVPTTGSTYGQWHYDDSSGTITYYTDRTGIVSITTTDGDYIPGEWQVRADTVGEGTPDDDLIQDLEDNVLLAFQNGSNHYHTIPETRDLDNPYLWTTPVDDAVVDFFVGLPHTLSFRPTKGSKQTQNVGRKFSGNYPDFIVPEHKDETEPFGGIPEANAGTVNAAGKWHYEPTTGVFSYQLGGTGTSTVVLRETVGGWKTGTFTAGRPAQQGSGGSDGTWTSESNLPTNPPDAVVPVHSVASNQFDPEPEASASAVRARGQWFFDAGSRRFHYNLGATETLGSFYLREPVKDDSKLAIIHKGDWKGDADDYREAFDDPLRTETTTAYSPLSELLTQGTDHSYGTDDPLPETASSGTTSGIDPETIGTLEDAAGEKCLSGAGKIFRYALLGSSTRYSVELRDRRADQKLRETSKSVPDCGEYAFDLDGHKLKFAQEQTIEKAKVSVRYKTGDYLTVAPPAGGYPKEGLSVKICADLDPTSRASWNTPTEWLDANAFGLDGDINLRDLLERLLGRDPNLDPNGRYRVEIQGRNGDGDELAWSKLDVPVVEETSLSPPRITSVDTLSPTELHAAWEEPDSTGKSPPFGWRLRYRQGDSAYVLRDYSTNLLKDRIGGLLPNRIYEFQVQAISDQGESEWSEPATGKTIGADVPDKPDTVSAELSTEVAAYNRATDRGNFSVRMEWLAPNDNGYPITDYETMGFQPLGNDKPYAKKSVDATEALEQVFSYETSIVEEGYKYKVRARNKAGWGPWSDWVQASGFAEFAYDPLQRTFKYAKYSHSTTYERKDYAGGGSVFDSISMVFLDEGGEPLISPWDIRTHARTLQLGTRTQGYARNNRRGQGLLHYLEQLVDQETQSRLAKTTSDLEDAKVELQTARAQKYLNGTKRATGTTAAASGGYKEVELEASDVAVDLFEQFPAVTGSRQTKTLKATASAITLRQDDGTVFRSDSARKKNTAAEVTAAGEWHLAGNTLTYYTNTPGLLTASASTTGSENDIVDVAEVERGGSTYAKVSSKAELSSPRQFWFDKENHKVVFSPNDEDISDTDSIDIQFRHRAATNPASTADLAKAQAKYAGLLDSLENMRSDNIVPKEKMTVTWEFAKGRSLTWQIGHIDASNIDAEHGEADDYVLVELARADDDTLDESSPPLPRPASLLLQEKGVTTEDTFSIPESYSAATVGGGTMSLEYNGSGSNPLRLSVFECHGIGNPRRDDIGSAIAKRTGTITELPSKPSSPYAVNVYKEEDGRRVYLARKPTNASLAKGQFSVDSRNNVHFSSEDGSEDLKIEYRRFVEVGASNVGYDKANVNLTGLPGNSLVVVYQLVRFDTLENFLDNRLEVD